jgi:hypothetical protein
MLAARFQSLSALLALALVASVQTASAQTCTHDARYARKPSEFLHIGQVTESGASASAQFELVVLGNLDTSGVPTVGTLEGKLTFNTDRCAALYSSPENSCSLIVVFSGKAAKVYQVDHCHFGAGARADGTFVKSKVLRP